MGVIFCEEAMNFVKLCRVLGGRHGNKLIVYIK